jgi:hypothetical protein
MINVFSKFADGIGLIGVIIILVTYFLLNTSRISAHTLQYQILNFIGSWLILFSLLFNWNLAAVLIEVAWILISMMGAYRILTARHKD